MMQVLSSEKLSISISEIHSEIIHKGFEVQKVKYDKKNDRYTATAKHEVDGELEAFGKNEKQALANLLNKVVHKHAMGIQRVARWKTTFESQLAEIAEAYSKAPSYEKKGASAFMELAAECDARAETIKQHVQVTLSNHPEPYQSAEKMYDDIRKRRKLEVSAVAADQHPIWTKEQVLNYRICIDVLGFTAANADWGWEGTNQAFAAFAALLPELAQEALFSELVGQTAYATYYRAYGPAKIALLTKFIERAMREENPHKGFRGIHPSQMLMPSEIPEAKEKTAGIASDAEMVPVDFLAPYIMDHRRPGDGPYAANPEYYEKLKNHIAQNGFEDPLTLDYDPDTGLGRLGEGNHRLAIAQDLGLSHVPVHLYRTRLPGGYPSLTQPGQYLQEHDYFPQSAKPSTIGIPVGEQPYQVAQSDWYRDKYSSAAPQPPNFRKSDGAEHCGNCKMFDKGLCWGYGNKPVEADDVCDSWSKDSKAAGYDRLAAIDRYDDPNATDDYGDPLYSPQERDRWRTQDTNQNIMYHAAPARRRKDILTEGLRPDAPPYNQESGHTPGVYMWETPERAYKYMRQGPNMYNDWDVHAVDTNGLNLQKDPWFEENHQDRERDFPDAWYTTDPVSPDRIKERSYSPWSMYSHTERRHVAKKIKPGDDGQMPFDINDGYSTTLENIPTVHYPTEYEDFLNLRDAGDVLDGLHTDWSEKIHDNSDEASVRQEWRTYKQDDPEGALRITHAIANAIKAALSLQDNTLGHGAATYQALLGKVSDDPEDLLKILNNARSEWNTERFGDHTAEEHRPWATHNPKTGQIPMFALANHIYEKNDISPVKAHLEAQRMIHQMLARFHEQVKGEENTDNLPKDEAGWQTEHKAVEKLMKWLDIATDGNGKFDHWMPEHTAADSVDPIKPHKYNPSYDQFDNHKVFNLQRHPAIHIKNVQMMAKLMKRLDQITEEALVDVHNHDGKGHHFRAFMLSLEDDIDPKTVGIMWLLLAPYTSELSMIDDTMRGALGHHSDDKSARDYFLHERELMGHRDGMGLSHIPLGHFNIGLNGANLGGSKKSSKGVHHQDLSALRVENPKPAWKVKLAPEHDMSYTFSLTPDVIKPIQEQWNNSVATQFAPNEIPAKTQRPAFMPIAKASSKMQDYRNLGLSVQDVWNQIDDQ